MQASETRAERAMPLVRRILKLVGRHYPDARWGLECPADESFVILYLYVDVPNSWRIDDLARPVVSEADADDPRVVIVVEPAMIATFPGVHSAPI